MNVYLLRDCGWYHEQAIVVTKTTTKEKLIEIISSIDRTKDDLHYRFDQIKKKLPSDCELIPMDSKFNADNTIYIGKFYVVDGNDFEG